MLDYNRISPVGLLRDRLLEYAPAKLLMDYGVSYLVWREFVASYLSRLSIINKLISLESDHTIGFVLEVPYLRQNVLKLRLLTCSSLLPSDSKAKNFLLNDVSGCTIDIILI